jgi:hypothetical protein
MQIRIGRVIASIVKNKVSYDLSCRLTIENEDGINAGIGNGEVTLGDGMDA